MGKWRENTQKVDERRFSLSLPSGTAVELYAHDGRDKDGNEASIVRIERKDGEPLTRAEIQDTKQLITQKITGLRSAVRDVFENWSLAENHVKFSLRWFETAERNAVSILNAQSVKMWTHQRVRPEALKSLKRIAQAIVQHARNGKRALQAGKTSRAKSLGIQIVQLLARFLSEPDRVRGQIIARSTSEGGKSKGVATKDRRLDWKRRADEIRRTQPNLSDRSVAKIIVAKIGGREETVRKIIKRPKETQNKKGPAVSD